MHSDEFNNPVFVGDQYGLLGQLGTLRVLGSVGRKGWQQSHGAGRLGGRRLMLEGPRVEGVFISHGHPKGP